jgi:hypothetical protein
MSNDSIGLPTINMGLLQEKMIMAQVYVIDARNDRQIGPFDADEAKMFVKDLNRYVKSNGAQALGILTHSSGNIGPFYLRPIK